MSTSPDMSTVEFLERLHMGSTHHAHLSEFNLKQFFFKSIWDIVWIQLLQQDDSFLGFGVGCAGYGTMNIA